MSPRSTTTVSESTHLGQSSSSNGATSPSSLLGKHVGMVTFSPFPYDPRPRRAVDALLKAGMSVDLVCLNDSDLSRTDGNAALSIYRIPIANRRGSKLSYVFRYAIFILLSTLILALRSLKRRYDLVYVHNMPDILVASAIVPKVLGAKVILDQHDPMPELMTTIFNLEPDSASVRIIRWMEKWSMARTHLVVTVNLACKHIFAVRRCPPEKIAVVMNAPDAKIFRFQAPAEQSRQTEAAKPFV